MAPLRRREQLASVGGPSGGKAGGGATTERDLHIQADSALRIYGCTGSTDKRTVDKRDFHELGLSLKQGSSKDKRRPS